MNLDNPSDIEEEFDRQLELLISRRQLQRQQVVPPLTEGVQNTDNGKGKGSHQNRK